MSLFLRDARVVLGTPLCAWPRAHVRIEGEHIAAFGHDIAPAPDDRIIDVGGRVVMPGFVDAHTHACWAGDRLDEFRQKLRGASYLQILAAGGGILSTVRAVRAASEDDLTTLLSRRLAHMLREGTTTVEIKSGYGLSTEHELKMLRAIRAAARTFPGTVVPTALLGHAIDRDAGADPGRFVDRVVGETLPAVHAEFPGITVDAFCEEGAWSVADCRRLLEAARALGHPLRLHADQFQRLGGVDLAIDLQARSVDHLEATPPEDLARLARADVAGVFLPATGLHTDGRYGKAWALLDEGGTVVLASNYNPGSSPTSSMPLVAALARRYLDLDIDDITTALTSAPARVLGLDDRGRVAPGQRADLIVLRHDDERQLGYELGGNPVEMTIVAGRIVVDQSVAASRSVAPVVNSSPL